jgi:hypothetical protein
MMQELFMLLAHATANNDQLRRKQPFNVIKVGIEPFAPFFPTEALQDLREGRCKDL